MTTGPGAGLFAGVKVAGEDAPVEIPDTQYAKTLDGGYIAYKVLGEGLVDIALAGSIAANVEVIFEYEPAARFFLELASFSRLILHDRRGTGLSDDMGGLPDLETRAADLLAVLDAVNSEHPTILAAGDGGMVGALLAATHPGRVGSLVWLGAQARVVRGQGWPYGRPIEEMSDLANATEAGWGSEAFVILMYPPLADPAWTEGRRFLAKLQRHACGPATAFRFITLLNEYDVRDVLPTLQLPTLVLAPHAPSSSNPAAQAQSTANLIPGAICHDLPPGVVLLWHDSVADEVREFLGVERPPPEVARVLATVMFTDIVGSTETAARLGDARWKEVLAAHDERARREIERHRGRYINTTGDGLLATFDGPARAVRCAQAIGEDVRSLGIEIRAGCHTGEIELVGEDIHGIGVHIGARVAAMAGPFEVLVSSTVKDLVSGSGLAFEDAGEHELKGVPDRWHLYRVVSEKA